MDLIEKTKAWIKAPFTQQMDLWHVVLLTIAVLITARIWGKFINHLDG